jgi:hypothetical protein
MLRSAERNAQVSICSDQQKEMLRSAYAQVSRRVLRSAERNAQVSRTEINNQAVKTTPHMY